MEGGWGKIMADILIVDDDKNICQLLELYLANEGYSLTFAHDSSKTLDALKTHSFDLVILDVMLPLQEFLKIEQLSSRSGKFSCRDFFDLIKGNAHLLAKLIVNYIFYGLRGKDEAQLSSQK